MADTYPNYAALAAAQIEGTDYRVRQRQPAGSALLHMAIHAGGIEPGSGECADYCAGADRQFYAFEGIKSSGNSVLHLTSTNFDEPRALAQCQTAAYTISWHGASGSTPQVFMGGTDTVLRDRIRVALDAAGFTVASTTPTELDGNDPASINQKNRRTAGVQIELTLALRQSFFPDSNTGSANRNDPTKRTDTFYRFCNTVRTALAGVDPVPAAGNWLDYTTQTTEIDHKTWTAESNTTVGTGNGGVGGSDGERAHCLAVTATAAGPATTVTRYLVPATAVGTVARLTAAAYTPSEDIPVQAIARWYAANGTTLVSTSTIGATPPARRWTYLQGDAPVVPAGATQARLAVTFTATAAGQTAYLDHLILGSPDTSTGPLPGTPWRRIQLGYPRLGRRRTDISFATGVNIVTTTVVPQSADDYAQVILATGAGEGRARYRAIDAVRNGRLRLEHHLDLPDVRGNDVLERRARAERTWRQRMGTISDITVIDHPAAPYGSWQVGDDVQVTVHDQWVDFTEWMRITGWRTQPDGDQGERFVISLERADSYHYGPA
ncbi:poly-gamma-glutamate hydrolase family protein [Streptomyces antimycoticus]|uniref:poly-gamma-glutamate hydrolase family protein n=1 Tax=Streptomyces antimycoticus TaxID=68175 RepID=UPI003675F4B3